MIEFRTPARRGASLRRITPLWAAVLLCLLALPVMAQDGSEYWYETEALNPGLPGAASAEVAPETPRQSLREFTAAAEADDYDKAAHYLNLSRLSPEEQAQEGPEIAMKLASILARRVWIDWSSLPARPDARIESSQDSSGRAGQPRRDLHIETLEAGRSAYDIRIARYKPSDADAVWLFTPQTVANVGPLYAEFGPRRYESMIPDTLKRRLFGLWLWEWIAVPAFAFAVFLLGWGTYSTVEAFSRRARRGWLKAGLDRSALPMAMLVMAGLVHILLTWVISFSGPVQTFLRPALTIVMVWGVGMTALRMLDAGLHRITLRYVGDIDDKLGRDEREFYTSIYALRRLIVLVMVGFAAIAILSQLNLFESVGTTLLASAGVLTVIFGIAGQAVLGNIVASLQIAFAKPIRIGDAILFEGEWAYVESIFYTFLRLRTWDHRRIVVPVKHFVGQPFENWSVTEARMMRGVHLWLDPLCDLDALRKTFDTLRHKDPDITEPDEAFTYVTDQRPEAIKVSFYAMMPDPSTGWAIHCRLREGLLADIRNNHPEWLPRERILDVAEPEETMSAPTHRAGAAD